MTEDGSIRLAHEVYQAELTKDATDYLAGFTETATLVKPWSKSTETRECYDWCEQHLGIKYKDWYMMNQTVYFKNTKGATMFRLMWSHLVVSSKSSS